MGGALAAVSECSASARRSAHFWRACRWRRREYRDAIGARLTSLRDFLLLFFFIDLGARLDWSTSGSQLGPSAFLSLFVLIGNPLIVMAIMGYMGYRRARVPGRLISADQRILAHRGRTGVEPRPYPPKTMGLITLVGVLTIFVSTYMIFYSGPLYLLLATL